jgi:hypothetical protein
MTRGTALLNAVNPSAKQPTELTPLTIAVSLAGTSGDALRKNPLR